MLHARRIRRCLGEAVALILLAWIASASAQEAARVPVFVVDERVAAEQCRRLQDVRARRDGHRVQEARKRLGEAAAGTGNLLPRILEAVRASATIGEICDTLRAIFGVHEERVVL